MATKRKFGIKYAFPITLVSLVGFWFVITLVLFFTDGSMSKLYKDIGALPWKRPDYTVSIPASELHSHDDIMAAVKATQKCYEEEWYSYNGTYILQLGYSEELNELKKDENEGEWIYLESYMYTGYGNSVNPEDQGKYHKAYWAVEKQPVGSWLCRGCTPMDDDKESTLTEFSDEPFNIDLDEVKEMMDDNAEKIKEATDSLR